MDSSSIENIIDSEEYNREDNKLNVVIGRQRNGRLIVRDLKMFPHIILLGYTGSGKSTFMRTIISEVITEYTNKDVRFIIIDSKQGAEYNVFNLSSHLLLPVITSPDKISAILLWLVAECDRRLHFLADYGYRSCQGFNANNKSDSKLPEIFVVFDDFASLSLNGKDAKHITKIILDGRAAGIHLVIVSTNSRVVPGTVLSGLSCRICFRVSESRESSLFLGTSGAESLESPGELYYKFNEEFLRCYGVYSYPENVKNVIYSIYKTNVRITDLMSSMEKVFSDLKPEKTDCHQTKIECDPYLVDAGYLVTEKRKASSSMVQRVFKVGYNRASKIIDELEKLGVIGPEEGMNPRRILMNRDQWTKKVNELGLNSKR